MNNLYRKLKKNSKALSPVVASIILIAVTVAVSVVVAAWMGGMTIGLMGNAEQVSVSNAVYTDSNSVLLTIRNTGGATVTISSATIDGNSTTITPVNIAKGTTEDLAIDLDVEDGDFSAGAQYEIRLSTAKGTTVVYSATYNPIA